MDFNTAFARLIKTEGGFTDDPKDSGNWTGGIVGVGELKGTKFGIAASSYGYLDIKNLTVGQAKEVYERDFWNVIGDADPSIKFQIFDASVNHGRGNAIRFLQRAVRVADDGKWGAVSQTALDAMDKNDVLLRFIAYRFKFWASLKAFAVYGAGWTNRGADDLLYAADDN